MSKKASIEVTIGKNQIDGKVAEIAPNLCRTNLVYKDEHGVISPLLELYDRKTDRNKFEQKTIKKDLNPSDFTNLPNKMQFMLQHEIDIGSKNGKY